MDPDQNADPDRWTLQNADPDWKPCFLNMFPLTSWLGEYLLKGVSKVEVLMTEEVRTAGAPDSPLNPRLLDSNTEASPPFLILRDM